MKQRWRRRSRTLQSKASLPKNTSRRVCQCVGTIQKMTIGLRVVEKQVC
jgi:hypothetical protein